MKRLCGLLPLAACSQLVGLDDVVPADPTECARYQPIDFARHRLANTVDLPDRAFDLEVVDANRDGRADIVISRTTEHDYTLLVRLASSTDPSQFGAETLIAMTRTPARLVDLNGDGAPDLVGPCVRDHCVSVSLNSTVAGATVASFGAAIELANLDLVSYQDVDGDGLVDVLEQQLGTWGSVRLHRNTSPVGGTTVQLAAPTTIALLAPLPYAQLRAVDLNGDGKRDLLVWGTREGINTSQVGALLQGDTAASFGAEQILGSDQSLTGVADFDGDGRLDLLTNTTRSPYASQIFTNTTSRSSSLLAFAPSEFSETSAYPQVFEDLDNDGKIDTLYMSAGLFIYRNTTSQLGSPTFTTTVLPIDLGYPSRSLGDVNGDHRTDLVMVVEGSSGPARNVVLLLSGSHCDSD